MTDTTVNPGTETIVNPGAENTEVKTEVVNTETLVNKTEVKPEQWYGNDWREKIAGADAKELARLQRFTDPSAVYRSYRELEAQVSSGALKQAVDTSKFDEKQLADYRTANGIPATPGEYEIDLPEGLVLSDEDEVILGSVLEVMHAQNRKPNEVTEVVGRFLEARETAHAAFVEQQKHAIVAAEETLRKEWQGQDYMTNINAVKNLLASAGEIGGMIGQARLPDGSLVGSNPQALKWLATMALELNPAGTVVPGTGADQLTNVESELNQLNDLMKKDLNAWRKNDAARARHRELIDAQLKLKARGY